MIAIRLAPRLDLALAQLRESLAIPRLRLAVDLMQLDCSEVLRQPAERASGIDLRKLPIVADQDQLGRRVGGVLSEPIDRARADHARLIDDQHRTGSRPLPWSMSTSSRAIVVLSIPARDSISTAARAASAHPKTRTPSASHASRAAASPRVLPVPAAARTICTPSPEVVSERAIAACSSAMSPRAASRSSTLPASSWATPSSWRRAASVRTRSSTASISGVEYRTPPSCERVPVLFELDGLRGRQPAVGQRFEPLDTRALAVSLGPVTEDVAAVEGRRLLGDPAGRAQILGDSAEVRLERRSWCPAIEDEVERPTIEPELSPRALATPPEVDRRARCSPWPCASPTRRPPPRELTARRVVRGVRGSLGCGVRSA